MTLTLNKPSAGNTNWAADINANWTTLEGAVVGADFGAHSIIKADTAGSPSALTVDEQTLVGRITGGQITALSQSQIHTLLFGSNSVNENITLATGKSLAGSSTSDVGTTFLGNLRVSGQYTQKAATVYDLQDCYSNTASASNYNIFRKSRGTVASPSALSAGDELSRWQWFGYGATELKSGAYALVTAGSAFSDTSYETLIDWYFAPASGSIVRAFRFSAAGITLINNADLLANTAGGSDLGSSSNYFGSVWSKLYNQINNAADATTTIHQIINQAASAAGVGATIAFQGTSGNRNMAWVQALWEDATNNNAAMALYTRGGGTTTERWRINSTGQFMANADGSASAPAVSRYSDPNTGMYFYGADQIAFAAGGNVAAIIDATGVKLPSGSAFQIDTDAGASGSFTTADSKTVTVVGGIITSIA